MRWRIELHYPATLAATATTRWEGRRRTPSAPASALRRRCRGEGGVGSRRPTSSIPRRATRGTTAASSHGRRAARNRARLVVEEGDGEHRHVDDFAALA